MKENVDLTENRDFRIKALEAQNGSHFIGFMTNMTPMTEVFHQDRFGVPQDDYYIGVDNGVIIQGNALERCSKNLCKEFNMGNYCDCCGKEIKPYYNDCLCPDCDNRMSNITETPFRNFI
jgi:hypothetical protein